MVPGRCRRNPCSTSAWLTGDSVYQFHEIRELSEARGYDRTTVEEGFADEILPPNRAAYTSMLVDDEGNLGA